MVKSFSGSGPLMVRADGGNGDRLSSLTRCLLLVNALESYGFGPVTFVVRDDPGIVGWVRCTGHDVVTIPLEIADREESILVRSIKDRLRPRAVILDLPDLTPQYAELLTGTTSVPAALFDQPEVPYLDGCLVFNANIAWWARQSARKDDGLFGGPDYAILSPAYQVLSRKRAEGNLSLDAHNRVLANLVGCRATDIVPILQGLRDGGLAECSTLIVGPEASDAAIAEAAGDGLPSFRILRALGLQETAAMVASCEVALIPGDARMYETACIGVPSLVVCMNDAERDAASVFEEHGVHFRLGERDALRPDVVRDQVTKLLSDEPQRLAMSRAGRRVVDGLGADRTAEAIANRCEC